MLYFTVVSIYLSSNFAKILRCPYMYGPELLVEAEMKDTTVIV